MVPLILGNPYLLAHRFLRTPHAGPERLCSGCLCIKEQPAQSPVERSGSALLLYREHAWLEETGLWKKGGRKQT